MADEKKEEDVEYQLPSDPGIAVYANGEGQVVIRQKSLYGDDDQFVFFSTERAERIVQLILSVRDEIVADKARANGAADPSPHIRRI